MHGIVTPKQVTARPYIRLWLYVVAGLVFAMVIVGGATRLTDSGLSITEWKPISGALPPLSDAAWQAELSEIARMLQGLRTSLSDH